MKKSKREENCFEIWLCFAAFCEFSLGKICDECQLEVFFHFFKHFVAKADKKKKKTWHSRNSLSLKCSENERKNERWKMWKLFEKQILWEKYCISVPTYRVCCYCGNTSTWYFQNRRSKVSSKPKFIVQVEEVTLIVGCVRILCNRNCRPLNIRWLTLSNCFYVISYLQVESDFLPSNEWVVNVTKLKDSSF